MTKINLQGIKDNLQHIVGIVVGLTICKPLNLRFSKEHWGNFKMFSHVSANLAADGIIEWLPYTMVYKTK